MAELPYDIFDRRTGDRLSTEEVARYVRGAIAVALGIGLALGFVLGFFVG